MDLDVAKKIISDMGWSPVKRARRKGTLYLYARKRNKDQIEERYIAPLSRIEGMTEQEVLARLNRQ